MEGGEGTGKSTVSNALYKHLQEQGQKVIITREPGGTPAGEQIRQLVITSNSTLSAISNTLLFAAARNEHVTKVIRPKIEEGHIVISDRFILSTIAYQGAGEGVSEEFITNLHNETTNAFYPDLTIILDVNPRIGIMRSNGRLAAESSNEDRFEKMNIKFHDRMREAMLKKCTTHHIVIDASKPIEQMTQEVIDAVDEHLRNNPKSQKL